jgi:hypothetical protein
MGKVQSGKPPGKTGTSSKMATKMGNYKTPPACVGCSTAARMFEEARRFKWLD